VGFFSPIFNIADSAIVVGAIFMVIFVLNSGREREK
jgi:lipoprotein signal peptidase